MRRGGRAGHEERVATRRQRPWSEGKRECGSDLRLRVLGTAGLAAGLAASSHFDGCEWVGGVEKKKLFGVRRREKMAILEKRSGLVVGGRWVVLG